MPFTPFHFGPGLLLKSVAPARVSFTAFCAAQVLIDLESAYHLFRGDWPVHRELHSLLSAAAVGIMAGSGTWLAGSWIVPTRREALDAEVQWRPALLGGTAGGASHPLLDGIMHSDVRPFWPFSTANPPLDVMSLTWLHGACVAAGVLGLVLFKIRSHALSRDR